MTYGEGDRWEKRTWEGLTAEFYVSAEYGPGLTSVHHPAGPVHLPRRPVGDTRARCGGLPRDSQRAIWDYTGDYLWYGGDMAFGPCCFSIFDGDAVSHIDLVTIMD